MQQLKAELEIALKKVNKIEKESLSVEDLGGLGKYTFVYFLKWLFYA